jgi:hypothetical protein
MAKDSAARRPARTKGPVSDPERTVEGIRVSTVELFVDLDFVFTITLCVASAALGLTVSPEAQMGLLVVVLAACAFVESRAP